MLKNISNLGSVLNRAEQQSIKGGVRFRITCIFSDGLNWSGATGSSEVATNMDQYCSSQGGTTALSYEF